MATNQYVVFKLDNEEFGIEIMNVKEIIPYQQSINVPDTPDFIEGIINYRGNVIPIINLKRRFKLEARENVRDARIIVITLEEKDVGFIVDEASQTLYLDDNQIEAAPDIVINVDEKYIMGVGKIGDQRLLILLDLKKVLTKEEQHEIEIMEEEMESLRP